MEVFLVLLSIIAAIAAVVLYSKKKEHVGCLAQATVFTVAWIVMLTICGGIIELMKSPEQKAREQFEEDSIAHAESIQDSIGKFQKEQQELINEIERTARHAIKDNMNDADSFELVDENIAVQDKYWEVWIKFRGTNALGAKVLQECTVKIDKETKQVISME